MREQPALLSSISLALSRSQPPYRSTHPAPAGSRSLRAELRPVKTAAERAPQPRFAHAAAVLPSMDGAAAEVVVLAGVNEQVDLSDVHIYSL